MPQRIRDVFAGKERRLHAPAPGLAAVLAVKNVSLEQLSEMSGYPLEYLERLRDHGLAAPLVVTSKISALLAVEVSTIRGPGY